MPLSGFGLASDRARLAAVAALIASGPALLGGCASTGGSSPAPVASAAASTSDSPTAADVFFGSSASPSGGLHPAHTDIPTDYFLKQGYCPPVQIKLGTEDLQAYDHGHDADPAFLKTQSSIAKVARECHWAGNTLTMKIGVAGRVIAGPKGAAGALTLPIRVAIVKQDPTAPTSLYSQLFKVPVSLTAPDLNSDYSQVIDQVTLQASPDEKDYLVYVGFDEGKPKAK